MLLGLYFDFVSEIFFTVLQFLGLQLVIVVFLSLNLIAQIMGA